MDQNSKIDMNKRIRFFVLNNIVLDSLRVLFEEFSLKETSLDLKEKSKALLKLLNTIF